MEKEFTRIVQITDMHLFDKNDKELLGVNTNDSFDALFKLLIGDDVNPDLLILTGDLSQDGSKESYLRLADMVSVIDKPVYFLPGNHDNAAVMYETYPHAKVKSEKQIILNNKWQLILLDSHIPEAVPGYLNATELEFMERCLNDNSHLQTMIFFHHHPITVGCKWLDNIGLTNANELWDTLINYPQVTHIIFGHVHQEHTGEKNHIICYSSPSTCIQFKTQSDKFALEKLGPAYRILDLYSNGQVQTQVRRATDYVGNFDENAKGY